MSHTKKPTIEKIILALLGLLALAALVRTMFLGLEIDEEYALSLGFRLVRGDRLFYSMWEPHQLAALPPALLIGLFTAVAGTTTGVLLFVRGAVLAVKLALAVWFYRSLRGACTPEETPTGHEAMHVLQKSRCINVESVKGAAKPQNFFQRKWEAFRLNWLPYLWLARDTLLRRRIDFKNDL